MAKEDEKVIEYSPEKKGAGLWGVISLGFVITWLCVFAGGVFLYRQTSENSQNKELKDRIAKLQENIDTLNKQVEADKTYIARLSVLEDAISELPSDLPDEKNNNKETEEIINLKEQLSKLEERVMNSEKKETAKTEDKRLSPVIISVVNLRERIEKSLSYESDLAMLKKISQGDDVLIGYINLLEKNLAEGVPTSDELKSEFRTIAGKAVSSSKVGEQNDFWNKALATLSESVTVRKVGADVEGETAEALIARAEANIKDGDFKRAVEKLKQIQGKAATILEPWFRKAERYLATQNIFDEMYNHVNQLSTKIEETLP